MPVCFALSPRVADEWRAIPLQQVDDDMRRHFGAPPSETEWFERWYDTVGFMLAMGKTWTEIRELYPNKVAIVDWLEANYVTDAWREVGR